MPNKTVLITGGNKGIGFEIARQMGHLDFKVFLAARDEQRGQQAESKLKAENLDVQFIQLDVTNIDSIKLAYDKISTQCSHLDVLINNAAIQLDKSNILDMPISVLQKTIETNVYGVIEVTKRFYPLMKKDGRIINISSQLGSLSSMGSYAPAYSISKTTLNAVTRQFSSALSNLGISVNSVHPGWVRTDMGGKQAPLSVDKGAETAVWLASEAPHSLTGKFFYEKKEMDW
jgi:NAD(P)-dependent dehydrogenase (short-subunit alcohol dehydrogenase family)